MSVTINEQHLKIIQMVAAVVAKRWGESGGRLVKVEILPSPADGVKWFNVSPQVVLIHPNPSVPKPEGLICQVYLDTLVVRWNQNIYWLVEETHQKVPVLVAYYTKQQAEEAKAALVH